ncbi:FtsH protease activity modulator HflK [Pseudochelatococcus contaminans]|uniref:Protein HflK n=1 Tax=Pseudochelatococcus contaminans TaxID=1538103 RepID=A0A7W5Z215_9HYPH|nr:FtsH protease activity modulator HflK [Pseudochelatococcus contaminans]MBB3808528.1 membrane protease subunit HflK [Pseudochelatococcus contaminans]
MPWSNQSGGPWGQKPQGPWGTGPQGGGGGQQPDLEDILRRGQDKLKGFIPGGGGGFRGFVLIGLGAVLLWLATGFYTVRPDEVGLNLIFGRYVGKTGEGLRYNLPYPIGTVIKPRVTTVNTVEVGQRTGDTSQRISQREVLEESLMLTGDENIVDINFTVQWQVSPTAPEHYVFNLKNPDASIKAVAEAAMREVVGRRNIQAVLTTDRSAIEDEVRKLMQAQLDEYGAGVEIRQVQLQKVDPPQQVIDAFRDVQAARQDQDRVRNEAETYASRIVPEARGEASRIVQAAEGYREGVTAEARGEAARFKQVYETYKTAPAVTRERMLIETLEKVFGDSDKVILDKNGQETLPVLPLGSLQGGVLPGLQQQAPRAPAAQPAPSSGNVIQQGAAR